MSARKEQGPLGLVLNACDELGKVRDMLELLFVAGGGLHAAGETCGSGISFGAATAQHALDAAQALLLDAQGALSGGEA